MNSIKEKIQMDILYQIKTDDAYGFLLDKIDFLNKTTQQFYESINEDQTLQVKGFFGTHQEVEREVEKEINNKVNLKSLLHYSEKGNLSVVKLQNYVLFCLILSEKFFITKPINEKAIEIVLFRILQDLTDNIYFCLNDDILKKNWYIGEVIPFSTQELQRTDYDFVEEQNKEGGVQDCKWLISQDIYQKFINSQTQSPKLTAIRQIDFGQDVEKELLCSYDTFTKQLLIQMLKTQDKQINQLITIFKREYQIKDLLDKLNELSTQLENAVKINKNKLMYILTKSWRPCDQLQKNYLEAHLNKILQTVDYQQSITYKQDNTNEAQEKFLKNFKNLDDKFKQLKSQFLDKILEVLKKLTYYEVQKVSLKVLRLDDNPLEHVESIVNAIQYQLLFIFIQVVFKLKQLQKVMQCLHFVFLQEIEGKNQQSQYYQLIRKTNINQIKKKKNVQGNCKIYKYFLHNGLRETKMLFVENSYNLNNQILTVNHQHLTLLCFSYYYQKFKVW